jgi:hypothetical protein
MVNFVVFVDILGPPKSIYGLRNRKMKFVEKNTDYHRNVNVLDKMGLVKEIATLLQIQYLGVDTCEDF